MEFYSFLHRIFLCLLPGFQRVQGLLTYGTVLFYLTQSFSTIGSILFKSWNTLHCIVSDLGIPGIF